MHSDLCSNSTIAVYKNVLYEGEANDFLKVFFYLLLQCVWLCIALLYLYLCVHSCHTNKKQISEDLWSIENKKPVEMS